MKFSENVSAHQIDMGIADMAAAATAWGWALAYRNVERFTVEITVTPWFSAKQKRWNPLKKKTITAE